MESIKTRFKRIPEKLGISNKTLAEKLSETEESLDKYLEDEAGLPLNLYKKLNRNMGINLNWLLLGTPPIICDFEPNEEDLQSLVNQVFNNGYCFLKMAIDEFESNKKYSLVHFYIGLEILLKTGLLMHDWKLIIQTNAKSKKTNKELFNLLKRGIIYTIYLDDIFSIYKDKVKWEFEKHFTLNCEKLKNMRNQIVHFFEPEDYDEIVRTQLYVWIALKDAILQRGFSEREREKIRWLDSKFIEIYTPYSSKILSQKTPEIEALKANGKIIRTCHICKQPSCYTCQKESFLVQDKCVVCENNSTAVQFPCPKCGKPVYVYKNSSITECDHSDKADVEAIMSDRYKTDSSIGRLLPFFVTFDKLKENLIEFKLVDPEIVASCACCGSYNSIVKVLNQEEFYFCSFCFETFDKIYTCKCGHSYSHEEMLTEIDGYDCPECGEPHFYERLLRQANSSSLDEEF